MFAGEHLRPTSIPLPTFEDYFADPAIGKDFKKAATTWMKDRSALVPHLPNNEELFLTPFYETVEAAVVRCDGLDIFSSRFDYLTGHIKKAARIVLWSEGTTVQLQQNKVTAVKDKWEKDYAIPPDSVDELIGETKIEKIDEAIVAAESMVDCKRSAKKETLPIVIIEDKITNIMKVMKRYITKAGKSAGNPAEIPEVKEDYLDKMTDGEFAGFLEKWKTEVHRHADNFRRFRFVYVPPEKEAGEDGAIRVSPIRDSRVRQWLSASNDVLKEEKAKQSILPNTVAGVVYKRSADQFFHIQDEKTDLKKIITDCTVVVADVDGPLVSQMKILATREKVLREAARNKLEEVYQKVFFAQVEDIAPFILRDTSQVGVIRLLEGKHELRVGYQYLNEPYNALVFAAPLAGNEVDISVNKLYANTDNIFRFNRGKYRQALEAAGYVLK